MKYEMDIHEVMKLLPHRYPFILIDRVIKLTWVNRWWRLKMSR